MPLSLKQADELEQPAPACPAWTMALMQDLIDALWLERLYDFPAHCRIRPAGTGKTAFLEVQLDQHRTLRLAGQRQHGLRPFRLAPQAALLLDAKRPQPHALSPQETVAQLQEAAWWQDKSGRFLRFFHLSHALARTTAADADAIVAALQRAPHELLHWERLSTLKDRPFHPLARAKDWDGDEDVAAYLPKPNSSFTLAWVAVPRIRLRSAAPLQDGVQPLADALLAPSQRVQLERAAQAVLMDGQAWLWLPVHPWQWRWLQTRQAGQVADCVLLGSAGSAAPTASLRSLVLPQREQTHLKLSLSVNTLGAIRTLPPRYLHNAVSASAFLNRLREHDPWLDKHMLLCDENDWWAAGTDTIDHTELIADRGELACLLRRYPALPGRTLVPMAALPACLEDGTLPAFVQLLGGVGDAEGDWRLLARIAALLAGVALRCVVRGALPEMHGQNVLLVCRGDEIEALLLRDHDTLRICPAQIRKNNLDVPVYHIDRSTPNTLELDNLDDLLAYFQTLAVGVNLYAVLAALAQRHDVAESHGWRIVREAIASALAEIPMSATDSALLHERLLAAPRWPFKQVLAPLLERQHFGTGMPSRMGSIANPLVMEQTG